MSSWLTHSRVQNLSHDSPFPSLFHPGLPGLWLPCCWVNTPRTIPTPTPPPDLCTCSFPFPTLPSRGHMASLFLCLSLTHTHTHTHARARARPFPFLQGISFCSNLLSSERPSFTTLYQVAPSLCRSPSHCSAIFFTHLPPIEIYLYFSLLPLQPSSQESGGLFVSFTAFLPGRQNGSGT